MTDIVVILNASSGDGDAAAAARLLQKVFGDAGREARVELVTHGDELRACALRAVTDGCRALVAGGGDGTINAVASAVVGTGIPLGVLPLGSLNHFAKDLGLPLDLADAAGVVLAGHVEEVDVGEVNGRIFLNNSSIGVYPKLVRLREHYQRHGVGKWIAAAWALLVVLRWHSFMAVRLVTDGVAHVRRTPFVFVGNNDYRMDGLRAGTRDSMTGGRLSVVLMDASGRRSLLWLALQILLGRARAARELEATTVTDVEIETRRGPRQVAIDGEVCEERGTLRYRIRPRALSVFRPRSAGAVAATRAGA